MEFFAKFVLCSNNELNPIYIEQGETRYWVRKVEPVKSDNPNLLGAMVSELAAFVWHLQHRELSTQQQSRMWFRPSLLETEALRKIVSYNRTKVESEMLQIIADILEIKQADEYKFCIADMAHMLEMRDHKVEHTFVRRILQQNWQLHPSESIYYTSERLSLNGSFTTISQTGRCYTMTKEKIENIL